MLPQPFEVDVAHEGSSLLGPVLVAFGAIVASGLTAGLTVVFANRRHGDQLKADRDLQRDQLEHDRTLQLQQLEANQERFEKQLAYDREIRFREGVQAVIDGVIERERSLRYFLDEYVYDLERAEARRERIEADTSLGEDLKSDRMGEIHRELMTKRNEAADRIFDGIGDTILLRIRIGRDPVVETHNAVIKAMHARFETVPLPPRSEWQLRIEDEKTAEAKAEEGIVEAQTAFLSACRAWNESWPGP